MQPVISVIVSLGTQSFPARASPFVIKREPSVVTGPSSITGAYARRPAWTRGACWDGGRPREARGFRWVDPRGSRVVHGRLPRAGTDGFRDAIPSAPRRIIGSYRILSTDERQVTSRPPASRPPSSRATDGRVRAVVEGLTGLSGPACSNLVRMDLTNPTMIGRIDATIYSGNSSFSLFRCRRGCFPA